MVDKVQEFKGNFHRPYWWRTSVLPYINKRVVQTISPFLFSYNNSPCYIMEEDWDNLIILDACRYDLFRDNNTLEGDLEYRISHGSATPEFLSKNFSDRHYLDTVYVTANPMYRTLDLGNVFHKVVDVWSDYWDDDLHTVQPKAIANVTAEVYHEYPHKRILSHFMQPHYPFIGEKGDKIGGHAGFEHSYRIVTEGEGRQDNPNVWDLLERGETSRELVWEAYRENLELALPHVQFLLDKFEEKSVVTSDHGNFLGEKPYSFALPLYGHPRGIRHSIVSKVPWLVVDNNARKDIIEGSSSKYHSTNSAVVSERLSDLGYVGN